ncbi:hypothetical protein RD792_016347 [Penstemon davidsonii]|uniref:B box-type domain-containing protein n=1 Tax=Penstemon davidsonii TaxID=160366 RepID=A0ABR0CJ20_9LAMI|nr:hypothetical protein RD792_016347 [Penstemon davidsonii]
MKIQCDFCGKEEAYVLCTADEAALCQNCDKRVHNANKLATKHHRFSLLHPQYRESPFCDICQERRALLFCQEDRALLCRECDIPIHKSNEHTKKHNRFLLTGAKISAAISSSSDFGPSAASSSSNGLLFETEIKNGTNFKPNSNPNCSESSSNHLRDTNESTQQGSVSTSSISEYLTETLPGWQVEEFLELDPSSHYGFCKLCCMFTADKKIPKQ